MTQTHAQGWQVGMQVFVVRGDRPSNLRTSTETITKIGRKWVTLGEGWADEQFDAETGWLNGKGYSSPGRVWASEDEYRLSLATEQAWTAMKRDMPWNAPSHLTLDDIQRIRAIIEGTPQ